MTNKTLIAVAWPYVNGDIHVGHLAGYLLPADVYARFCRLKGDDVIMVSGSDCHGTPITVEADKQQVKPAQIVEKYHKQDLELFRQYELSYNLYTKTTTRNHKRVVQEMFLQLLDNGFIVKDYMKQYYSVKDKQFLPDRYVEGTCPYCKAKDQRSDQCENCGRWLGDGELIDPRSKLTGAKVELRDTEHYFLNFPELEQELKRYVQSRRGIWRNWILKEAQGWLAEGMKKRAITRDMDWAIELPVEELKKRPREKQLSDYTGKRIYVWFEAVIGYLSAAIEWSASTGLAKAASGNSDVIFMRQENQAKDWKDWWLNDNAKHYYFMGQDNLVFHTLMWPSQLMGTKQGYSLPYNVVVNKFMNYEGKKFSKSRNWTIDSKKLADKYGVNAVRYYILSNLPENKEANFTWEGFVDAVNNELVANLGNFINRTLKFFEANFEGELNIGRPDENLEEMDGEDNWFDATKVLSFDSIDDYFQRFSQTVEGAFVTAASQLDNAEFVNAFNSVMQLSRFGNVLFDKAQIWKVIKEDRREAENIMWYLLNLVCNLSVLMLPFLPEAGKKLQQLLGLELYEPKVGVSYWHSVYYDSFKLTGIVEPLFAKFDKNKVLTEKEN